MVPKYFVLCLKRYQSWIPSPTERTGPLSLPVVQRGPWVPAAADLDHEQGEEQEEHGHAEAGAVHRLVAHQHVAVHMTLDPGHGRPHPAFAEARDLHRGGECMK